MRADPPAGEKDAAESREERTDRECQAHAMLAPRVPGERHHRSALGGEEEERMIVLQRHVLGTGQQKREGRDSLFC